MRQFSVIGLGQFGMSVARELAGQGREVIAVDIEEENINEIAELVTSAVQLDATNAKSLKAVGVDKTDAAVVCIGRDIQASILICMTLKDMGVPRITAKAANPVHGKVLERIGVDKVVYPEIEMGRRIARNEVSPSVVDFLEVSPEHSVAEMKAPEAFVGKTLGELDIRKRFGVDVIALKNEEEPNNIKLIPSASEHISRGDILVVAGKKNSISKLR